MKLRFIMLLYIVVVIAQLYSCWPPMRIRLRYATKMMLMPLLALWFLFGTNPTPKLMFVGMLCGFAGDLLLLAANKKSFFFVIGSTLFGIGHIFYSVYFQLQICGSVSPVPIIILSAVYAAYLFFYLRVLYPKLRKVLFFSIGLYLGVICFMSVSALMYGLWNGGGWNLLPFFGSLVFVFSDGYLIFDKYVKKMPYRHVVVMFTYILAQTSIAVGVFLKVTGRV